MLPRLSLHMISRLLLLFFAFAPTPLQASNLPWPLQVAEPRDRGQAGSGGVLQQNAVDQIPLTMRKMSDDEGEMFWPEYWGLGYTEESSMDQALNGKQTQSRSPFYLDERDDSRQQGNASLFQPLQAAFALHSVNDQSLLSRLPRDLSPLDPRAFSCPGGTTVCTSINRPNSCCPNGSTCQIIPDAGSGDVGCCQEGQTCGNNLAGCASGYSSCPDNSGGGCCIPGYRCLDTGCVMASTAVTTVQPVVTASPPISSSIPPPPPATTPAVSSSNIDTSTPISTSTHTAITSVTSTATSSPSHLSSLTTPSSSSPPPEPTSNSAILPIRPTSSATSLPTLTTTAPPMTITASTCPTGFYQCSAYDHLGCCRVGRDCGLTSCPAAASSLAVNSNGVTVNVIPSASGSGSADGGGNCAAGWFSCAQGQGGGCCPMGYACGTSCTATGVIVQGGQTGTATVAKNNLGGRGMEMNGPSGILIGVLGLLTSIELLLI
ncbi:Bud site selection protein 6 [Lecanora helva]